MIRKIAIPLLVLSLMGCQKGNYSMIAEPWSPDYKLDRSEASIKRYEAQEANEVPVKNPIVLAGSSSFTLWKDAARDLSPLPIVNRGFGGSTLPEVIFYLDRTVLKHHPASVVVYCENDMFGPKPKSPEQTRDAYVELTRQIRKYNPKIKMFYVSMKPSPSRWASWPKVQKANQLIKDFVDSDKRHEYIDISEVMLKNGRPDGSIYRKDSLHMNEEGYKRWIAVLKPVLSR